MRSGKCFTVMNFIVCIVRAFRNDEIMRMRSGKCFTMTTIIVCIVSVFKSERSRLAGYVATIKEGKRALKILTGKPTGKTALGVDTLITQPMKRSYNCPLKEKNIYTRASK